MRFNTRSASAVHGLLLTAVFADSAAAWGASFFSWARVSILGYYPNNYNGNWGKRDLSALEGSYSGLEARDFDLGDLEKRQQDSTCGCVETTTAAYALDTLEPYMATPFGKCEPSATTSNLCPTDYNCVCQNSATSRCLPTTIAENTDCTTFTGEAIQPSYTVWWLSSTLKYGADPSGQCGGTPQPTATTSWDSQKTECPANFACGCQKPGYSLCVDTREETYTGTMCPNTCKYEFKVSLPPPSATAKIGGQCGGKCWTGPTNCPDGATCFTETSPSPGAYAMCHTTKPDAGVHRKLRIRGNGDAGINVPARVQAIATPIYF